MRPLVKCEHMSRLRRLPNLDAGAADVLRLPLGVWARVAALGEAGGGLLFQVGTLLSPNSRRSAAARYGRTGQLEALAFLQEARAG